MYMLNNWYTVEPRLSGPRLSGTSIIRHGLPIEKGVGLFPAHVQSHMATEKGGVSSNCACAESHGNYSC